MKSTRMRAAGVAAVLAVTALVAGVGPASGDGGAKSKIVIKKLTSSKISGKISSKKDSCESGRHVQVFRYEGYVSVKVERGDAQSDGDWKFKGDYEPGKYFAKVDSKPGCRYDVSKNEFLKR
jgi:hypothetical protein